MKTATINATRTFAIYYGTMLAMNRKFSFNASGLEQAIIRKNLWCKYHGFQKDDYNVKQVESSSALDLHNEYVNDL